MTRQTALEALLEALLERARPRADRDQPGLAAPQSPDPLLIQQPRDFVALALGVELLHGLSSRGGVAVDRSAIQGLREGLRARLTGVQRAHLDEEALRSWLWLEETLTAEAPPQEVNEDDNAAWRALIRGAIDDAQDVLVSYLDDARGLRRARVRPARLWRDEAEWVLSGERVPDSEAVVVDLSAMRWLCVTERFSPIQRPQRAAILSFPALGGSRQREPGEDQGEDEDEGGDNEAAIGPWGGAGSTQGGDRGRRGGRGER